MRLSTAPSRDDEAAVEVVHAALDAGVRLLDTADAYCHHAKDVGHNERLIAGALASWSGDRAAVTVATKGGLTRPAGKWVPDGRAKHLRAACEASLRALGVSSLDLYQLHAPDPKAPLRTSLRALARLQREKLVQRVGLCNVTVAQIEQARAELEVATVQVELGPYEDGAIRGGVASYCRAHGITLLAHRPLGGERHRARLQRDPVVSRVAARRGCTSAEVVLAWLRSLDPNLVPLPGPTTIDHARSCARVGDVELQPDDLTELDAAFEAADILRRSQSQRRPPDDAPGEVVVVMGIPGAGKTTVARELVDRGYARLNRDREGGRLADLVPKLDAALEAGERKFVLDNTYPTRRARNLVVETAWKHGVPARCIFVDTPVAEARINAVHRMLDAHGRLLGPDEIASAARVDPGAIGPRALLDFGRKLEPPVPEEGFAGIEVGTFERLHDPQHTGRLLVLDVDRVLGRPVYQSAPRCARELPAEIDQAPPWLLRHVDQGWIVAGFMWRPELETGTVGRAEVEAELRGLQGALGFSIDVRVCPHRAGAPVCWCRPPMPGLVVSLLREHRADPRRSAMVSTTDQARRFAQACGLSYRDADGMR